MASQNETSSEIIVMTPPQSLSRPIDYIDLTQDTPINRGSLSKRIPGRLDFPNAVSRGIKSTIGSQQPPLDEVINVDESPKAQSRGSHLINDSINGKQVTLGCPVCLEDLSSKLKPMATRCGHIFCEGCLQAVLRTSKKCPSCQTRITVKTLTRLYF